MKIGLLDLDSHNFPNLALMKISSFHKNKGDEVEMFFGLNQYDKVYISKVFTFSRDYEEVIMANEIIKGGTGYGDYRDISSARRLRERTTSVRSEHTSHTLHLHHREKS